MLNKCLALALSGGLVASGAVWAQATPKILGAAADVKGLVTVSDGTTVSSVVNRSPIVDGARFVTSSTGSVTLKFDQGCDIKLEPNQSLVVRGNNRCEAILASVQSIPAESTASAAPTRTTAALLALGAGGLAVVELNRGGGGPGNPGGGGGVIPPVVTPPGGGGAVIPELPISGQ